MIKISKLADYAVVVLASLGKSNESLMTASELSLLTRLPEPTVAKVLKILTKAELLISVRGVNGGYKLAKPLEVMSIADIVSAVDGPVALTACVDGIESVCDYESSCPVKGRWDGVNAAVRGALESVSLVDMINVGAPVVPIREEGADERYISGNH